MGLLDDLKPAEKKWPCKIKNLADTLDKNDAKILLDAVMDEKWKVNSLVRALAERGIRVSESPITAHRGKACSCWKI